MAAHLPGVAHLHNSAKLKGADKGPKPLTVTARRARVDERDLAAVSLVRP